MAIELTRAEGVTFLRSSLISCKHGFSTRLGGVSTHAHTAELNLAFRRGDEEAVVLENLRLFSNALGIDEHSVVSHHQIHSKIVREVTPESCGEGYFVPTDDSCDGYVTKCPGVALGVKSADCVPILFHDPVASVIGAVHAGWRGTASGIAAECVRKMCELGSRVGDIRVAVGAAIHFCCYEVGEDFYRSVAELVGEALAGEFIRVPASGKVEAASADSDKITAPAGRLHADIVGLNERLLLNAGILPEHIDISPLCTCCEPELFYSHRASKGVRGTMLSVISL